LIEKYASASKNYIELPYKVKGMDVAFSGIQTKLKQMLESGKYKIEDLSYSLQETVFAMLVETAERAMAHTGKKELLLGGGVACNSRLQEMCRIMCEERGAQLFLPENGFLIDNGAMIAWQGLLEYHAGRREKKLDIYPYERCDEIAVLWRTAKPPLS